MSQRVTDAQSDSTIQLFQEQGKCITLHLISFADLGYSQKFVCERMMQSCSVMVHLAKPDLNKLHSVQSMPEIKQEAICFQTLAMIVSPYLPFIVLIILPLSLL